jgi:hypothetical protein
MRKGYVKRLSGEEMARGYTGGPPNENNYSLIIEATS